MSEVRKQTNAKKNKKSGFFYAIGRRKTASARVRLYLKKGPILVNEVPIDKYFPLESHKTHYLEPFRTTNTLEKYSATVKVVGSGKSGQLRATVHGFARALAKADPQNYRPALKKRGLLTRDSRTKERRKPGYAQAARAKKQSPKR